MKYIALLRGINVGGNNIIKMVDLKACFETLGFSDVTTYIQSGNVIFTSRESAIETITDMIQSALTKTFGKQIPVVVISAKQLKEVVEEAPKNFGKTPEEYRYDVIFLKAPLTSQEAIKHVPVKEGVDEVFRGTHVLYFSRLIAKATQSKLTKIIGTPIYQSMTIRNWNTTTKLFNLLIE